jgi:hypothetical protein
LLLIRNPESHCCIRITDSTRRFEGFTRYWCNLAAKDLLAGKHPMISMVESTTGAVAVGSGELPLAGGFLPVPVPHSEPWLRFQLPLIEPGVPVSGTRLSDWLQTRACGGCARRGGVRRRTPRGPKTTCSENRRVPRDGTRCRRTRKRRTLSSTC